jgi:hypothetical protein
MKILTKTDILSADDLATETVDVPEWSGAVIVRTMTGTERDAFEAAMVKVVDGKRVPDLDNLRAKLLAATLVDEAGNPLFAPDDLAALGGKRAAALDRIFAVAQRMNGLSPDAVEEAEKNSVPGPSAGSTSA